MILSPYLVVFVVLPAISFLVLSFLPKLKEAWISHVTIGTLLIHLTMNTLFGVWWMVSGADPIELKSLTLYSSTAFEFFIDFYFDKVTAVFAFIGSVLVFLVAIFSRFYMHRDEGFKRFFNTLLFFFIGYNLVVFSGNF